LARPVWLMVARAAARAWPARLVPAACLALVPVAAAAGAWTLERGQTKTYVTSTFTYGDHGFNEDGDLVTVPEYRKFTLDAALEYGLREGVTAILRGELRQEVDYGEVSRKPWPDPIFVPGETPERIVDGERTRAYGAVAGGTRVRLYAGTHSVLSAQGLVASGGVDGAGSGAPSDGPYVEARGLFGIGGPVLGRHTFLDVQGGYRLRFNDDDTDEIVVDLTVGARVLPRWLLLAQSFSTFEVDGQTHFTKAGGSIVYALNPRLSIEAGGIATVAGRNTVREFGGRLGFWWTY